MSKTKISILALLAFGSAATFADTPGIPSGPVATVPASVAIAATKGVAASAVRGDLASQSIQTSPAVQPAPPLRPTQEPVALPAASRATPTAPVISAASSVSAEPTLPPAPGQASAPDNLAAYASPDSRPFTLGEVEYKQGELARARMDADIAKAKADTRGADNSAIASASALAGDDLTISGKKKVETDPARDFAAYSYYKFQKHACADILFRGALFTRCAGDSQSIGGWQLSSLTPEQAVFVKGHDSRAVPIGVAAPSHGLALPVPPVPVAAVH